MSDQSLNASRVSHWISECRAEASGETQEERSASAWGHALNYRAAHANWDDHDLAAAEHYLYAYHAVLTGDNALGMTALTYLYEVSKIAGMTHRAGDGPVSPGGPDQLSWGLAGIRDAQQDLAFIHQQIDATAPPSRHSSPDHHDAAMFTGAPHSGMDAGLSAHTRPGDGGSHLAAPAEAAFTETHHAGSPSSDSPAIQADHNLAGASFTAGHHATTATNQHDAAAATGPRAETTGHMSGASFTEGHPDYSAASANYSLPDGGVVYVDSHGHSEGAASSSTEAAASGP